MFKCVQHSNKTKTRQNSPITEYISVSMIGNDNRTKWSPIRSVIILVTDKIRQPRSGSPICQSREWLRIGRQEVQLQINQISKTLFRKSFASLNNKRRTCYFWFYLRKLTRCKENKSIGLGNQSNIPCQNLVSASIKSGHVSNSILPGV